MIRRGSARKKGWKTISLYPKQKSFSAFMRAHIKKSVLYRFFGILFLCICTFGIGIQYNSFANMSQQDICGQNALCGRSEGVDRALFQFRQKLFLLQSQTDPALYETMIRTLTKKVQHIKSQLITRNEYTHTQDYLFTSLLITLNTIYADISDRFVLRFINENIADYQGGYQGGYQSGTGQQGGISSGYQAGVRNNTGSNGASGQSISQYVYRMEITQPLTLSTFSFVSLNSGYPQISWTDGSGSVSTGTVSGNIATFSFPSLVPGTYRITARTPIRWIPDEYLIASRVIDRTAIQYERD